MPTDTLPQLITVKSAQERWSISRTGLYRLLATGDLRARKLGGRTLIEVASGDSFMAALPPATFRQKA